MGGRFHHMNLINRKILAQNGHWNRGSSGFQVAQGTPKKLLVGQNTQRGGATLFIHSGDRRRGQNARQKFPGWGKPVSLLQ